MQKNMLDFQAHLSLHILNTSFKVVEGVVECLCSCIKKLIQIRNEEAKDWWDSISEDERTSIEKGIADADNDRLVSHAEARKLYEKWL